jgi:acetyl esterase/lipase
MERNLPYVQGADRSQRFDLYYSAAAANAAPFVVFIHGGGFLEGDKMGIASGEHPSHAILSELMARGYVVASLNYRLSGEAPFPAAVEDCKAAIRFFRANASRFGLATERIGVFGTSAGGNLASMLGVAGPNDGLEGGGNANQSSRVQAVADLFGPVDFLLPISSSTAEGRVEPYLTVPGVDATEAKRRASPVTYVSRDDPPFLILHGDKDNVVPLVHSEQFNQRLREAGVRSDLVVVQNGGHVFVPVGGAISPSIDEIARLVADFFDREIKQA